MLCEVGPSHITLYMWSGPVLCVDWPLDITDASKSVKPDVFKKQLEEAALIIKSTYWYVYIHVCTYAHMYACMYVCTYVCM